ncbi:MAG: universal stress protein [Pirellulaceae bacterium]
MIQRFQNILAHIDTRTEAHEALDWAAILAERNQARLHLVDVLPDFPWHVRVSMSDHDHVRQLLLNEKRDKLAALAEPLKAKGLNVTIQSLSGHSSVEVIREVLRNNHDLVVRLAKGPLSPREGFFGTTSQRLLHRCPCPLWLVKPGSTPQFDRVLAAVDSAPHHEGQPALSGELLELAKSICQVEGGKLDVIHAWEMYAASVLDLRMDEEQIEQLEKDVKATVERSLDALLKPHGMSIRDANVHLVKGGPIPTIVNFVKDHHVDLLVMGTIARSGISGILMGNTAEQIVNQVECSLLALKPKTFVSPVTL